MNGSHLLTLITLAHIAPAVLLADTYSYVDEQGQKVTIEARPLGVGQGFQALERRDGQLQIVPVSAIIDRIPTDGPEPLDRSQFTELLQTRFGEELIRSQEQGNFVTALILSEPIEKTAESKAQAFIQKASRFMNRVDEVFLRYAKSRQFPLRDPRFPMVLLIFESEEDFNQYAVEATGGSGLSAANIAGFYSPITNWLAVRMSSCDSFSVPLHEAIHQQMYNRVFNRLAPIPKWFDEGIATGFEGDGERISISPIKVNPRYAQQAQALSGRVNWKSIVENDGAFTADVLAGDAYTLAWCMHWLLANHHEEAYTAYVQELAERESLSELAAEERLQRFGKAFQLSLADLQQQFPETLELAARRQRVRFEQARSDGGSFTTQALGEANMKVIALAGGGNQINAAGALKNMSPLRSMTFYVTVETAEGNYAEWTVPDLPSGRRLDLERKILAQRFAPAVRMPPGSYKVFIRSVAAGSRESENWKTGNVPGPFLAQ